MPHEPGTSSLSTDRRVHARIDRLPRAGLSRMAQAVLGLCYAFTFYDIAVIGVTLPRIVADLNMTSTEASWTITSNLIGFAVGALGIGMVADRIGRRRALSIVVVLLSVFSLLTALSWDVASVIAFRALVGLGIGGQLGLTSALISEFSSIGRRGHHVARTLIWAACGNIVPAALAITVLEESSQVAWRLLFAIPAIVILALLAFRDAVLPESPRWLAEHGQGARAEAIVTAMEERARRLTGQELPPVADTPESADTPKHTFPLVTVLASTLRWRLLLVIGFWFFEYFAFYGFLGYETTLFSSLGYSLPDATVMTAIGWVGGLAGAVATVTYVERIERKYSVTAGLGVMILGLVLIAASPGAPAVTAGAFFVSAAVFLITAPGYTYTAEIFPTDVRASATGAADSIGHVGGAIAPLIVGPVLSAHGARASVWVLVVAMVISVFFMLVGRRTRGRSLANPNVVLAAGALPSGEPTASSKW